MNMRKYLAFSIILIAILSVLFFGLILYWADNGLEQRYTFSNGRAPTNSQSPSFNDVAQQGLPPLPSRAVIEGGTHVFQTFNNCGPASMSMVLSLYGVTKSQAEIGNIIRPYQIANGDNDDKSTTLEELAAYAQNLGFVAYHRPYGTLETIKYFLANNIPVLTRTITKPSEDIGHYRIIKGYDEALGQFIQDDSLQGKDLWYSYSDFRTLWRPYGYEYLVLVPKEKQELAEAILGENLDEQTAWRNAVKMLDQDVALNPGDTNLQLALAVAYYEIGDYEKSIEVFEQVEPKLSFRALWYQIEPLQAYQRLKKYDEVLPRIEAILSNHNRAFSELYQMRGEIYLDQDRRDEARREFELAVQYNENYQPAKDSLAMLQ